MSEWVRFYICAAFAALGVAAFIFAAVGVCRLDYVLLSLHASAIADTIGISSLAIAAAVYFGLDLVSLKLLCCAGLTLFTSPVSTHLLAELEYLTGKTFGAHTRRIGK